jgi:hypothetical protein
VSGAKGLSTGSLCGMSDVLPEDDEGRVNSDLEFEDAVRLMLNTDLREPGEDEAEAE